MLIRDISDFLADDWPSIHFSMDLMGRLLPAQAGCACRWGEHFSVGGNGFDSEPLLSHRAHFDSERLAAAAFTAAAHTRWKANEVTPTTCEYTAPDGVLAKQSRQKLRSWCILNNRKDALDQPSGKWLRPIGG